MKLTRPAPGERTVRWWVVGPPLLVLFGALSIEEVRSDPDPLDSRFYAGAHGGSPGHADRLPFAGYQGPTVMVSGHTLAPGEGPIDFDLWQNDPAATGARTHLGKLSVEPGAFSIRVPASFGPLQIEAFQDLTGDGPSVDDPFGQIGLEVGDAPLADLELTLEEGGLAAILAAGGGPDGAGPEHTEAEPGAPGGDPAAAPPEDRPFATHEGPTVTLSGLASSPEDGPIDLDLWQPDPAVDGARTHLGKLAIDPGVFHLEVPASFGPLQIEAFRDLSGDGPSADDPFGRIALTIGATPIKGLNLALAVGAMTAGSDAEHTEAEPGAPGGDPTAAAPGDLPFGDYQGPTVTLSGRASATTTGNIDLDLWQPNPTATGGRTHLGKLTIAPGAFSLEVPASFGALQIEAFQDLAGDGPSTEDPFGKLDLTVGTAPLTGLKLALEEGALAASGTAEHTDAAPGAPGGDPSAAPREEPPFADHEGPTVALSGRVTTPAPGIVNLDFWKPDPSAAGARIHLGKLSVEPGPFSVAVPASFGALQIEAFQDLSGDGPSAEDPFARADLEIRTAAIPGLKLALVKGAMPTGGNAAHTDAAPGAPGGGSHAHVEAPPGAPGGDPSAAPSTAQPAPDPFASVAGPRVQVSGTIVYADARALLDMDIFQIEPNVQGGRAFVGKQKVAAGDFGIRLPVSLGKVDLEVFLDRDGDGPTPGDPFASCPQNPISLSSGDVKGIKIELTASSTMAPKAP